MEMPSSNSAIRVTHIRLARMIGRADTYLHIETVAGRTHTTDAAKYSGEVLWTLEADCQRDIKNRKFAITKQSPGVFDPIATEMIGRRENASQISRPAHGLHSFRRAFPSAENAAL